MAEQEAMGGVLALTILYDGGCPLCLREVRFLQGRDPEPHRLAFVDINAPTYDPGRHAGISYRDAMGRIHAIDGDGTVLRDVAVFRRAYELIGLGWLYAPTGWPLVAPLAEAAYRLWARLRLPVTGRPGLEQLCQEREGGGPAAAAESRCRI
jgi:predicted DCC family thiol-disulfide oxidoreductase YuxK